MINAPEIHFDKTEAVLNANCGRINKIADDYYNAPNKYNDDGSLNNALFKKTFRDLWAEIYDVVIKKHKISEETYDTLPCDQFADKIKTCLKKYKPGNAGFYQFFMVCLKRELINAYKKQKNKKTEIVKDAKGEKRKIDIGEVSLSGTKSRDGETIPFDTGSEDSDIIDFEMQSCLCNMFSLLNEIIKKERCDKAASNSKCYADYLYTEFITRYFSTQYKIDASKIDLFYPVENDILAQVNRSFAVHYLDIDTMERFDSLMQLAESPLRPISCFNGEDNNSPCGYQLQNIVYITFLQKEYGKGISESAMSQNRNKFNKLIETIKFDR